MDTDVRLIKDSFWMQDIKKSVLLKEISSIITKGDYVSAIRNLYCSRKYRVSLLRVIMFPLKDGLMKTLNLNIGMLNIHRRVMGEEVERVSCVELAHLLTHNK
jgi:hypothetical protein